MTDELTRAATWQQIGRWQVSSELFLDAIFTGRCNRDCKYCIARTKRFCEEDYGKWKETLEKAFDLFPIDSVVILGGEATIDPLFWDKLSLVEQQVRRHQAKRIVLTTNGVQLTEPDFLERLCTSGISSVNLSRMHDDQEVNDRIFGDSTPTRKQIRQIHDALHAAGKTLRLNVNVWRGNLDTAETMERFTDCFSGCCDAIKFSPLMETSMFDVTPAVDAFTQVRALQDDEIRIIYDRFVSRQKLLRREHNVLGFVDYAEAGRGGQLVLLKYAQVEDKYDREHVIPTLKLYPNGCLSNEWSFEKDILKQLES